MKKNNKKMIIVFSIMIAIFISSIVLLQFQNDTFFNIAIGKYISKNGIDMKEHLSWTTKNLDYTYSHWAFDLVVYKIYSLFGFTGIYVTIIIFSVTIGITLFTLLTKKNKSPIISFFTVLILIYSIRECLTARSQIVSFLCFIIEIYCIEEFIETNKKKYAIILIILSIIIANFHSASWPLVLVLFLPYLASSFMNFISIGNIRDLHIKSLKKKQKKLQENSQKFDIYQKEIERLEKINNDTKNFKNEFTEYKIVRKTNYNTKNLIILLILIFFTGLLTPTHGTPYTYVIKSMFGNSNFESGLSIDYVSEMQPIIPISNIGILLFLILLIAFLTFVPSKIKTEHGFLIIGLLLMTLSSARYVYLLVFLGSYVLSDLITQIVNKAIPDDMEGLNTFFNSKLRYNSFIYTYYHNIFK